jgi:predicted MFS family arabinose efflux permease
MTRHPPLPVADPGLRLRSHPRARRWPFIAVAFAIFVMLAGSNLPTPLYPAYQRTFGLSALMVTLVFATYAATVMPCLLVFGPLSDAIGRRRVLIAAVCLGLAATGLFAAARGLGWLFCAQIVEGAAMGALQGAAVAALIETDPRGDRDHASLVGSALTVGGAAVGPFLAGFVAQYAPWPRRLPYLIEAVLLVVAFLVLVTRFDTDEPRRHRWRPQRPSVPKSIRRTFALASGSAFLAWAVASLFLSLIPSYVIQLLHTLNLSLVGAVAGLMLACSALSQLLGRRAAVSSAQIVGLSLVAVSAAGLVLVAHFQHLPVILMAATLAGTGLGLTFRATLNDVNAVVPEHRKGEIVASFYLIVYLGTALPVIGVGLAAAATGLLTAIQLFGIATAGASVVFVAAVSADRQRPGRLAPGP